MRIRDIQMLISCSALSNLLRSCAKPVRLNLPRPIFLNVGRVAVEKNLEAFLQLDLPGSKVVIGDGPARADLAARHPDAHFLGMRRGADLAAHYAAADVFVDPSDLSCRINEYGAAREGGRIQLALLFKGGQLHTEADLKFLDAVVEEMESD